MLKSVIGKLSPKFRDFFSDDELSTIIESAALIYDEVIIFLGWEHFIEIYCDGREDVAIYILHKRSDRVLSGTKETLFQIIKKERAKELQRIVVDE